MFYCFLDGFFNRCELHKVFWTSLEASLCCFPTMEALISLTLRFPFCILLWLCDMLCLLLWYVLDRWYKKNKAISLKENDQQTLLMKDAYYSCGGFDIAIISIKKSSPNSVRNLDWALRETTKSSQSWLLFSIITKMIWKFHHLRLNM